MIKPNFVDLTPQASSGEGEYILFVGRLAEYKGIRCLLKAYAGIKSLPLKIIGDGPLREEVKRAVGHNTHIEFLGRIPSPEVISFMRGAACVVIPSECYEHMPRVLLESFACGVPVIGSDIGAMREIIDESKGGLLFRARDTGDLRDIIKRLIADKDLRHDLGRRASAFYHTHFSKEKNFEIFMEIYKKALFSKRS